jgi:hypothetical protein
MSRTPKVKKANSFNRSSYHGWHPWRVEKRTNGCTVAAYVEATGLWQTIAIIDGTSGVNRDIKRLVKLVNDRKDDEAALRAAFEVLKEIEEVGFDFSTEQELERVIGNLE